MKFTLLLASKEFTKLSHAGLFWGKVVVEDRPNVIGTHLFVMLNFEAFPEGAGPEVVDAGEEAFEGG